MFNDLYNQRIKDVSFNWNKLLNPDGETGPYVQYTYARCSSILRNVGEYDISDIDYSIITDPASIALIKDFDRFPSIIEDAAAKYEPSVIARYVMDVAHSFNKFYTDNHINVEDEATRNARVSLVVITRRIIKDALALLGIGVVEQM